MNKMPSLVEQIKNLVGTAKRTYERAKEGRKVLVSPIEREQRWGKCQICDQLTGTRCFLCGCRMDIKSWLASERCELDKWYSSEIVSIIIPSLKEKYLQRTIDNLKETAIGEIEILAIEDEKEEGRRVLINRAAQQAKGKFLFIIDAHCIMSHAWDAKMKQALENYQDLVVAQLDGINEETWQVKDHYHRFVYLNRDLVEKWWGKSFEELPVVQETMAFTGCAWMVHKSRYWELGGYNETLEKYGGDGSEWALKIWLSGGRCLLHLDVVCAHLFKEEGEETHSVLPEEIDDSYQKLREIFYEGKGPLQKLSIDWLVGKFDPVPGWDQSLTTKSIGGSIVADKKEVTVAKKQISEVRDEDGKLIRKVIKIFKGENSSQEDLQKDPNVHDKAKESTEVLEIKVMDLQEDNTWKRITITDPEEIENWLFENE